jgi:hypothetical protein
VQDWLKAACAAVVAEVDGLAPPTLGGGTAADWRAVARETFPELGEDGFKHLTVAAFSDVVSILPPEENPFGAWPESLACGEAAAPARALVPHAPRQTLSPVLANQ